MLVHGGASLGEAWGHLRDTLKPTTPYAAECLACARTFEPPSKAHLKRLKRLRLAVTPVREPKPIDTTPRKRINEAMAYGREIERLLKPNSTAPAQPLPRGALPEYAREGLK